MADKNQGRNGKQRTLVVMQLSGGNDFMNTIIPYTNSLYHDYRPKVGILEDEVLRMDDTYGFHPVMGPFKEIWDEGKVAIIQGVGYPNPNRSHFRGMDIWHTCEPDKVVNEGWLGRALRDLDPNKENVLTGVNFGYGVPRALAVPGVPVTSVAQLETYGVLTGIAGEEQRKAAIDIFQKVYTPAIGTGPVMDYIRNTGQDALKAADIIKTVPAMYSSTVEYGSNSIAQNMRGAAQIILANVGTRILYAQLAGFDYHTNELPTHQKLWVDVSAAINDFFADLREHQASEDVLMLVFTEFGRRVRDNGNGTDHGSGGGAFLIGDQVKGGMYAEYPSLAPEKLLDGDLHFNYDFRGLYSSILDQWLGLDPVPIVNGNFEQLHFLETA